MYYQTLIADPPWQYKDSLKMRDGVARSSSSHYATLSLDKVKTFLTDEDSSMIRVASWPNQAVMCGPKIADTLLPDAFLWLWITNPFLLDGSGFEVCKAWGFTPKALITWTKGRIEVDDPGDVPPVARIVERPGMGRYTRGVTEHLILATRGKVGDKVLSKNVTNWFLAPRGRHSEKPQEAYDRIKRVTPGPYLALFERTYRDGFDVVGDELPPQPVNLMNALKKALDNLPKGEAA